MPAKHIHFTDKYIDSLKPQNKIVDIREGDGFGIRVTPGGVKTWFFIYRIDGIRRFMNLGHYPSVSLSDAKRKYRTAHELWMQGKDPLRIAEESISERRASPTIAELIDDYIEHHAKRFKKSWAEDERILKKDVLPAWGNRKALDIKKRDISSLLELIIDRGSPVMANNTFKIMRRMFNFAVEKDILPIPPTFGVKMPTPKVERDRVLSEKELKILWDNLPEATMSDDSKRALKLILVTLQRSSEVCGMHSSEIEDRWWTIPPARSKNKKEHRVYLSDIALELIGPIKSKGFIFPSPRKVNGTSINRHALSHAILDNCPSKCVNDCGACSIEECLAIKLPLKEKNKLEIPHFTPHDLRRTGATGLAKLKYSDEVIDAVLNHVKQGVVKIYNRYRYDKEKQQALEKWARQLKKIVGDFTFKSC